jgi:flagellar L-ring protein precursor FlgH
MLISLADAQAQSLFRREVETPRDELGNPDPQANLRGYSLLLIEAPKPRQFSIHDQITIIISESSRSASESTLDTKTDARLRAGVNQFPDLRELLQFELRTDDAALLNVDASASRNFKGDGKSERTDRFTDRITATVIDVKPNGVLVIEARRRIQRDEEVQEVVLSGRIRRDDVTAQNTVLSSQVAELSLAMQTTGEVREATRKGLFTRLFEAIFNF